MSSPKPGSALPIPVVGLGLAGTIPQVACAALALATPENRWFALAAGCCYAALILSFLGGMWWMALLLAGRSTARWSAYALSVAPSLIGWAALLPWCFGWRWPGPSLLVLGALLLTSPLVDHYLARDIAWPAGWLRLRMAMATGLGLATWALAFP